MARFLSVVRTVLLVAALVLGVLLVVWSPDGPDTAGEVEAIEFTHDVDNGRAEGAPQQQVVNGWTTHQYLGLVAEQQSVLTEGIQRLQLLLGLLVAVTAVEGVTRRRGEPQAPASAATAPLAPLSPPPPLQHGARTAGTAPMGGQSESRP